jgi:inorganic pyrophosphatase/exopolyphosphatase
MEKEKIYTIKEVLDLVGADKKYYKMAGKGLNVGGINVADLEETIRIPESAEKLVIFAPELEPIEIEL